MPRSAASNGRRLFAAALPFGLALWGTAQGLPDGAPWDAAGAPGCARCHFDAPPLERSTALALDGLPKRVEPGARYRLVVRLSDAQMRKAGFLLSVWQGETAAGRFEPADARTGANGAQARSTAAGATVAAPGSAAWTLDWVAPDVVSGPLRFELWGNAGNDDASPLGDTTHRRVWQVPEDRP